MTALVKSVHWISIHALREEGDESKRKKSRGF